MLKSIVLYQKYWYRSEPIRTINGSSTNKILTIPVLRRCLGWRCISCFLSRTLPYNELINVFHCTCQSFYGCGWSVYVNSLCFYLYEKSLHSARKLWLSDNNKKKSFIYLIMDKPTCFDSKDSSSWWKLLGVKIFPHHFILSLTQYSTPHISSLALKSIRLCRDSKYNKNRLPTHTVAFCWFEALSPSRWRIFFFSVICDSRFSREVQIQWHVQTSVDDWKNWTGVFSW